ncbi:helix-turn-helix transcriptional regulator [Sphingobium boeckii]|uniref:DNA-binding CsgD family transcriptional regulator n=1 Tax=Sphingobium boeckii TaxID=1082345 RepID=A0A7W9EEE9_9SPHN|nr:helix-turn-helix transcriptional regulator [Sphingobium boeckii]MBB5685954.1 DNA-binding CsgD family transcriptional regulator [Sphingobium boeckii]
MDIDAEDRLVAALFDGVAETPLWKTFLEQLRSLTGADFATLIFNPPGRPMDDALQLLSAESATAVSGRFIPTQAAPAPRMPSQAEGRPYALPELLEIYTPAEVDYYCEILDRNKISAIRQMRVREKTGVDAWLTIARQNADFSESDDALLVRIAPLLRGVLQLYVAMERERFAASLTAEAVRRLQFGWISLGPDGHIIDCDQQGALVLDNSQVLSRNSSGKLMASPRKLEREIYAALERIVQIPSSRPRAMTLNREPWLDMLLVPAGRSTATSRHEACAIAYVHGDNWHASDRHEQLGELFGLSPRESRLALAISRGMNLTEAAAEFGLTVTTARTYSKSIYSKTGARGLPDLVRIVMRSVLAIAPHD